MQFRFFWTLVLTALLAACAGPAAQVSVLTQEIAEVAQATATNASVRTSTAEETTTATAPPVIATTAAKMATATPAAEGLSADVQARIRQVEENLVPVMDIKGADPQSMTLEGRMAYFNVPGVSIAVINNGEVEWAKGYGTRVAGERQPVTPETIFQAASISKPVTALGELALVREGKLDLDSDVNTWLRGWKAPSGASEPITTRRLLSHTAGLGVHGFGGYAQGAELPSAEQILNGSGPANSPAVSLIHEPGSQFDYSGGGYVALQQLMMDVTGQSFEDLMAQRVFEPLGMERSRYSPLPDEMAAQAASGHQFDGTMLEGGWRVYPEFGPAGLWSTPSDLAKVLIEIDKADRGEESALLNAALAREMLTVVAENNALGLVAPGDETAQMFGHGGSNAGYRTMMFAVRGRGQGGVIMTNADNGLELIMEIFRAVAQTYDWPEVEEWRPGERHRAGFVEVDPQVFAGLVGTYRMGALTFDVRVEADQLMLHIPQGGPGYRLFPDSETDYFTADGAQFILALDDQGRAVSIQMNGWGEAVEAARRVP